MLLFLDILSPVADMVKILFNELLFCSCFTCSTGLLRMLLDIFAPNMFSNKENLNEESCGVGSLLTPFIRFLFVRFFSFLSFFFHLFWARAQLRPQFFLYVLRMKYILHCFLYSSTWSDKSNPSRKPILIILGPNIAFIEVTSSETPILIKY